jgi:hypothetical protein
MPMIYVKCPASGLPIATGVETDGDSFRSLPDVAAKVECPHCGMLHEWVAKDAWLSDRAPERAARDKKVP